MTAVAVREDHAALDTYQPGPPVTTAAVRDLVEWVEQARAAYTLAETLCKTAFVPSHFRGKPDDTAAAILTGYEMGMSPLAAVRSIFIISGTPGMYAKAMVAVLQSKGHDVWVEEQSDERVVVRGQRKGSTHIHETVWDRARVVKAKLTTNAKYQETPQQMMVARGQAEICRQVASDALHGIPYSVEELYDMPPEVEPRARLTAADVIGTPPAAIEQGEPTDAEVVDEPEREAPAEPITVPQQKKLHACLNELGWGERAKGLAEISRILDEPIASTKDLSKAEAMRVIDALDAELDRRRAGEPDFGDDWPPAEIPGGDAS